MNDPKDCQTKISGCFNLIREECRLVLGSELHYQAMIYHILRTQGIPLEQIGMNVKTTIPNVQTDFLKERILKKNESFQGTGIEIIPDISIYKKEIDSDWRRRNYNNTLKQTIYSLEIKASERKNSRLQYKEIETDVLKLKAQRKETLLKHNSKIGVGMLIIDVAPDKSERMTETTLKKVIEVSKNQQIDLWYFSPQNHIEELNEN